MEFKGTKGKWYLAEKDQPKLRVVSEDEQEDICECLLEADAKLIACAPEMLELLDHLIQAFYEDDIKMSYIERTEELIKKATT